MVNQPRRGEVWICDLGEPAGTRPVIVVSADSINEARNKVIAALGTKTRRNIPSEVPIGTEEGLASDGVASLGDLHTLDKERFLRKAGRLEEAKILILEQGLRLVLGLN